MKLKNIKEEVTDDTRKRIKQKHKTQWKATPATRKSGRQNLITQDNIEIKEKTEKLLVKQLKTCERNT
jgi:hypothetical protein